MKILNHTQTLQQLCMSSSKWGMYFNICPSHPLTDVPRAAPWLSLQDHSQTICDENSYVLFDSEEEMLSVYEQTVGDDGPTESNAYNGPVRVYALTCDPTGQMMNENT